jgi:hypothetical protein
MTFLAVVMVALAVVVDQAVVLPGFGMLAIDRRSLTDRSSRPVSPSYRGEDGSCGLHQRQAPAPCQRCRKRRRAQISGMLFRGHLS